MEMGLKSIIDWSVLDRKMKDDPDWRMPDEFIKEELQIERWNNIPIPLMRMAEQFERCFGNSCNIMRMLISENKRKSELIVTKFKKVDLNHKEDSARNTRNIDLNRKHVNEHLVKIKEGSQKSMADQN